VVTPSNAFETAAVGILRMLVQVDEPGGDHQAGRIDDASARQRLVRYARDAIAADADVAHGVQPVSGSMTRPPESTRS